MTEETTVSTERTTVVAEPKEEKIPIEEKLVPEDTPHSPDETTTVNVPQEEDLPLAPTEEAPKKLSRRAKRKLKRKEKKERFLHVTLDNDIRYRGPLSYRTLRILAWFLLFISQVGTILSFFGSYDAGIQERFGILAIVFKLFSGSGPSALCV